jgi:SpoIID/LytB domain protein
MRTSRKAITALLASVLAVVGLAIPLTLTEGTAGAYPSDTLTLTGHGFGHGRGLGQWGSFGYATKHGWTYSQILNHFYGGTTAGSQPNADIGVRLVYQDGLDLLVTSQKAFTVGGIPVPAGGAARLALAGDGQIHAAIAQSGGCSGAQTYSGPVTDPVFRSAVAEPYGSDLTSLLTVCTGGGTKVYRGALRLANDNGVARSVNVVPMEAYLRGVVPRESPASWGNTAAGLNALKAQAVAARSYAWAEGRYSYAKTCDTESCQVYAGAGQNGTVLEHANTDKALAETWQEVRRTGNGNIARTEFSSSTGGYTAGGTFPAVVDLGDSESPHKDWTVNIPVSTVESAYAAAGLGTLESVEVTQRNGLGADGGRVLKAIFHGSGKDIERTGDQVRIDFGLKSNWWSVVPPVNTPPTVPGSSTTTTAPPSQPAAGAPRWIVPNTLPPGAELTQFAWGQANDVVLSCDWNGDGIDSPGVYRGGRFFISNSQSTDPAGIASFPYGVAGDLPICGDWNGDRVDTIGVWRSGVFYLRNLNSAGPIGGAFRFGNSDDIPLVGDWNGDRADTPGVRRGDRVFLANAYAALTTDVTYVFGSSGDRPLIGDWDGNGTDELAVQRSDRFFTSDGVGGLRNAFPFGVASDRGIGVTFPNTGGRDVIALIRR